MNALKFKLALVLALGLFLVGCGDDDRRRDRSGGETTPTDVNSGGETTGGTTEGTTGGTTGGTTDNTCNSQNPEGFHCTSTDNCKVSCQCEQGNVEVGKCVFNSCASPTDICEDSCEDLDLGGYTGGFCYLGATAGGGTGGGTGGETGGETGGGNSGSPSGVGYGESCEVHADCNGWTGNPDTSEWFCISICSNKFCANDCSSDDDCPGFDSCDQVMGSCVPSRYDTCG